jgi:hypothetical protein
LPTLSVANVGLPLFHERSTIIPPRTRAPLNEPVDHAAGSAGSIVIRKGASIVAVSGVWMRAF